MKRLEDILRKDPLNTNRIQDFLDKIFYKKVPILKKLAEGDLKSKRGNTTVKRIKFKRGYNAFLDLGDMLHNSNQLYKSKIDTMTRSTNFIAKKGNIRKAQKMLRNRSEKMTIQKFLEEIRRGEMAPPERDRDFYDRYIYRNVGKDNKSYVGSMNPLLASKKNFQKIIFLFFCFF